ncbi:MAG: TetR family transcriptional regulator [Actinobacteria bacterium]|uniref:Unannotated protein n=1 Tax=freshwater metagenome TaxID=449393 RepID=A0A6J6NW99_9ZZZZ|nr:TetR family transcriptional regulator [Actinomycetota bacterium]
MAGNVVADARVRRSCAALSGAMLELLDEGRGLDLTVSALCERAGVSRPTFYQHFGTVDGLLSAAVALRLCELDAGRGLAPVLAGLAADQRTYGARLGDARVLEKAHLSVCDWLEERIAGQHRDADPTAVAFAAGGAARLLVEWLHGDGPRVPTEEMAARIERLVDVVLAG